VKTIGTDARLLHLSVGQPQPLDVWGEVMPSSFKRRPVAGPLRLGPKGLEGDAVGDTSQHGGPDKAISVYAFEHYAYWKRKLKTFLQAPAFGENFTTRGLKEAKVCVGDVFQVGSARIQVSQPRAICKKPGTVYGEPKLARMLLLSNRTGFYCRCLEPGEVKAGDRIVLEQPGTMGITIDEANRLMYRDREDLVNIRRLLEEPGLSTEWRHSFESRL